MCGVWPEQSGRKKPAKSQAFDPVDLSGIWMSHNARGSNFSMGGTVSEMTEWARARYSAAKPGLGPRGKPLGNDPMMVCDPMGFPRIMFWTNHPIDIVRIPGRTLMFFRLVLYLPYDLDGRAAPAGGPGSAILWILGGEMGRRHLRDSVERIRR
jgi:hypothetical protein